MRVTFLPAGRTVEAKPGDTLLDAALDNSLDLPHECGGNCACTTCHVIVLEGAEALSPMEEVEQERISTADGLCADSRLGCQAILLGEDVTVLVVQTV